MGSSIWRTWGVRAALLLVLAAGGSGTPAQQAGPSQREFANAAQLLGGYWRIRWGDDAQDMGVLQVTNVVPAANVIQFDGIYSPDGLTSCPTRGLLVNEFAGALQSGSAVESFGIGQLLRFHIECSAKEVAADLLGLTTSMGRVEFAGRATVSTKASSYQRTVYLTRFRAD